MSGKAADALARDVIVKAGYGDYFGHSLGHGVGLATHEGPRLSPLNDDALAVGSTVTVEPGIYLPGWGGVRIEDVVWLGPDGTEVLSHATKIRTSRREPLYAKAICAKLTLMLHSPGISSGRGTWQVFSSMRR
jgi:Xaa-Pro aminopeptidase